MSRLNEQITQYLQITLSPAEYQVITQHDQRRAFVPSGDEYWEHIPDYLIARCPLCGATYTEKLDTYSLAGWSVHPSRWNFIYAQRDVRRDNRERIERLVKQGKLPVERPTEFDESGTPVPKSAQQQIGCKHFVAVQFFINLNGIAPKEREYFSNQSEVPYVTSVFLPDDIESYVVMHSLPICRIEKGQFVPRYTVYMLTYYSARPLRLRDRRKAMPGGGYGLHSTMLYTWRSVKDMPDAWDLTTWVRRGKLLWLDLVGSELPLRAERVEDFPYGEIEGIRKSHTYRKGKLKVDPY